MARVEERGALGKGKGEWGKAGVWDERGELAIREVWGEMGVLGKERDREWGRSREMGLFGDGRVGRGERGL